jgi:hypothetical protein
MYLARTILGKTIVSLKSWCKEEIVNEEVNEGDVQKYYELLEKVETPLHDRTKHSKLSVTVHLYNLKCVGGVSNTIFSSFLEFINQLLPANDEALPVKIYEAKKYLRGHRTRV